MEVRQLQHRPAITCEPDATIEVVARTMRDEEVGSVIVVDDRGRIAGMVTDRDIVIRATAEGIDPRAEVGTIMTVPVNFVYENADAFAAATEMATHANRRLPVVDKEGHLTGVIALDDLVVTFTEELDRLGHAVRKEIQH